MRPRTRWLPIIIFALAGCGNETELPQAPTLFIDREALTFNREFNHGTYVGQTTYNSLSIQNRGLDPLDITAITLAGPRVFTLQLPEGFTPGTPLRLETYDRAFLTVAFLPTDDTEYDGTITIVSNAANAGEKVVTLNGLGVAP
ncbi:putative lipoprotein [Myxococcus hansupus]|uniref:Putative lipoprotein n=1 Tax=Pseudomyxococcus hansupus TaxID=1297742 RepID=A0A0H4WZ85_9BACT|nr:hypothetical protein [Myxococcus hansupus]AKQ68756.1 putative lipoprotein [Myxococcus hansupus]